MTPIDRAREAAWERLIGHRAMREQATTKADSEAVIESFLAHLASEGMVLVPKEATEEMMRAAQGVGIYPLRIDDGYGSADSGQVYELISEIYAAMIAASQENGG